MVERLASKKLILNNEPKAEPWNRLRKESNQAIGYLSQSTDNTIHSKYAPSAWKSSESCRADIVIHTKCRPTLYPLCERLSQNTTNQRTTGVYNLICNNPMNKIHQTISLKIASEIPQSQTANKPMAP